MEPVSSEKKKKNEARQLVQKEAGSQPEKVYQGYWDAASIY